MTGPAARPLALCAVLTLALAGCSTGPDRPPEPEPSPSPTASASGDAAPTDEDLAHAQAAWTDPWLAPDTDTVVAGPRDGRISTAVGSRSRTAAPGTDAVTAELEAATAAGWEPVPGCDGTDGGPALLVRGDGPAALVAVVEAGDPTAAPGQVTVTAHAGHHLVSDWPGDLAADGCDGVPEGPEVAAQPAPERRDRALDDAAARIGADPAVRAIGLALSRPDAPVGPALPAPTGRATVPAPGGLPAVVDALTDGDWVLTSTSCADGGPEVAELRRGVRTVDDAVAVLRLTSRPPGTAEGGRTGPAVLAAAVVTRPSWGGPPVPSPGDGVTAPCWVGGAAATTGTPWFAPTLARPVG